MAPEMVAGRYNELIDLWSCGVTIHVLLAGRFQEYMDKQIQFETIWNSITIEARSLLVSLLEHSPEARSTAKQALAKAWVNANCKKNDLHHSFTEEIANFQSRNVFQQSVARIIAHHVDEDSIDDLHQSFWSCDSDKNGIVTFGEIKECLASKLAEVSECLEELKLE